MQSLCVKSRNQILEVADIREIIKLRESNVHVEPILNVQPRKISSVHVLQLFEVRFGVLPKQISWKLLSHVLNVLNLRVDEVLYFLIECWAVQD